ncbi:MAG: hypothetical protein KKG60_02825 [Nanoarchaeota archaeon]|nr:hypothetical protein [Nanoarchaeota archaeon]
MLKTTNPQLTEFLNLNNGPTLIYGEAATGKTCLCLMAAIENAKTGKVIYIDTEGGFSIDRIEQIFPHYAAILKNIFFIRAKSFKQQHKIIQNLEKTGKLSLIIMDTIGNHLRPLFRNHKELATTCLKKQLRVMEQKAKQDIPILLTTQVYTNITANKIEPVGGNLLKSFCPSIIRLEQDKRNTRIPARIFTIEKPKLKTTQFEIQNSGITINK